jgi:hypothetical protein
MDHRRKLATGAADIEHAATPRRLLGDETGEVSEIVLRLRA